MSTAVNRSVGHQCFSTTQRGFSLVELVTVILLISILTVYAGSKLLGRSQFETTTTRDALVAELRRMQQAVLAGQSCTLVVSPTGFFLTDDCAGDDSYPLDSVSVLRGASDSFSIELGRLGVPINSCAGGCDLTVTGSDPQRIRIESEGFIHAL